VSAIFESIVQHDQTSQVYQYEHPRPAVAVDMILFAFQQGHLTVLLIRRRNDPFKGRWALPGGFVGETEDLYDAALRELKEETNVTNVYLEQLYTFGQPGRDPRTRVISVAYFALLTTGELARLQVHGVDDAGEARWWNIYQLPDLAFDHQRILDYALQRLRWKLEWTALGFLLLPDEFTLSELQRVYETVLNEQLDKRNFRRKILSAEVLEPSGNVRAGDHRPAKLYRFTSKAIELEQARRRFP
jgi:8-oxo-dGTP diphosphatase